MRITQEQFQGVIIGLAVGDAVGSPWEGLRADMIYSMGPSDRIVAHPDGNELFYTDDTQMMISVVQTLIETGQIEKLTLLPENLLRTTTRIVVMVRALGELSMR